jgi:hypothetical protein
VKVRLGLLKQYINEAVSMTRTTTPSAPTDDDATVPGHLPNELPKSASLEDDALDEEAWVPGRWLPSEGEPMLPGDVDRLGDPTGDNPAGMDDDLDETDDRTEGDGKGNGIPDPKDTDGDSDMAAHLRQHDDTSLGEPPQERPEKGFYGEHVETSWLNREIRRFMLQEYPAGAGMVDPIEPPHGFYTAYDQDKDHGSVEKIQGMWYRSPGRTPGEDGDPFRGTDPNAQLGFHPPAGENDPGTSPPATMGMDGVAARRAPPEWTLSAGGDTSTVLGANAAGAKGGGGGVGSEGDEEAEEGEAEGEEAEGSQQA